MKDFEYQIYTNERFITIPKIDDLCLALKEKFLKQEQINEELIKENQRIKDEKYASQELAQMKKRLEKMQEEYYNGFPITEEEREKINRWKQEHDENFHNAKTLEQRLKLDGVSGGRYSYCFIPTSIGTCGIIKCSCGAEFEFRSIG